MITDHAIVETQGYKIPLIGIAPEAMLQECDCCHDVFPIGEIEMTDSGQCYCKRFRKNNL